MRSIFEDLFKYCVFALLIPLKEKKCGDKNRSAQQVDEPQMDRTSPTSLFNDLLRVLAVVRPALSGNTAPLPQRNVVAAPVFARARSYVCQAVHECQSVSSIFITGWPAAKCSPKCFCCLANTVNVVLRFEAVGKFCPCMESCEQPCGSSLA